MTILKPVSESCNPWSL